MSPPSRGSRSGATGPPTRGSTASGSTSTRRCASRPQSSDRDRRTSPTFWLSSPSAAWGSHPCAPSLGSPAHLKRSSSTTCARPHRTGPGPCARSSTEPSSWRSSKAPVTTPTGDRCCTTRSRETCRQFSTSTPRC
ncbi:hypothetical protein [Ornithinimicrobium kibberense]|uniref:hypothetical protein n=1 Tax=Ornithinimicrobium kibberense TaxID=282060 RepID=UPI00361560C5